MTPQIFKPGDVGFIMHNQELLAKIMAWFMGSKWSHCFIVIEQTSQFGYILESSDYEIVIADLDRYIADPTVTMEVYRFSDLTDSDAQAMMQYAVNKNLGIIYGFLQLFSFGIRCLLKKIGVNIPNFIRQGLLCDENVLTALAYKVPEFEGIDPKSIQTEELYQKVIATPTASKVYAK